MEFFNQFLNDIKQVVADTVKEILEQIKAESCEQWVSTKEIAEHLGQSESWVNKNLNSIPHVKHDGSKRFKKSIVDQWRIETYGHNYELQKVNISNRNTLRKGPVKFIE